MILLHSMADLAATGARVSLAAGCFDGVHRGHRRVLTAAIARARALSGQAWVLTFSPHPRALLAPDSPPALLTPPALRNALLAELGIDGIVTLPFTPELASLSPAEFVHQHLLHGEWAPEVIFSGTTWRFGNHAAAALADIPALSHERIRVRPIAPLLDDGAPVSSTRIRAALSAGDLPLAERLLGRPFALQGAITHGRGIGRTLSAATANLDLPDGIPPLRPGVYAATATWSDSATRHASAPAVVNIGLRPTFHDATSGIPSVEAHLLHFSGDLYGKTLRLHLRTYLREERAFPSPEALAQQIQRDAAQAEASSATPADSAPTSAPAGWTFHPEAPTDALTAWIATLGYDAPGTLLQDGRNRTTLIPKVPGIGDVVVKHFGPQSPLKDRIALHGPGSKAMRAYRAAAFLHDRGIPTPAPLAVYELWQGKRLRKSLLVTRAVPQLVSFRRLLAGLYAAHGPCETLMERLQVVAEFCADMHDAGFLHRDLGNQNLFFDDAQHVLTLDLNRGRARPRPLSLDERARDLSRIDLPSDFLRVFLEMYWRGDVPPHAFLQAEHRYRQRYALHSATRALRHPIRERRLRHRAPDLDSTPAPRDYWIWDNRSLQAIPAFKSRDRHRYMALERLLKSIRATLSLSFSPSFHRAFRATQRLSFSAPIENIGSRLTLALTAHPETLDHEVALLRKLGARNVLLRLYAHESPDEQAFTLKAATFLHAKGFGVSLALVQSRDSILHPESWDALGRRALAQTASFVRWIEVGHAINRVKWGLWTTHDLHSLQAPIAAWKKEFPRVRFVGPGVIDFEIDASAYAYSQSIAPFDALSQHLYVDRRGPPERTQNGLDAVDKLAFLRTLGAHFGLTHGDPILVSEFNWPLLGQGVYSPVGSPYTSPGPRTNDPSVSEPQAAAFTFRYLLLALCSGHASEMVFWRLDAKGFGLTDGPHIRPAFHAIHVWFSLLQQATFTHRTTSPDGTLSLHFSSPTHPHFSFSWDPASNEMPTFHE